MKDIGDGDIVEKIVKNGTIEKLSNKGLLDKDGFIDLDKLGKQIKIDMDNITPKELKNLKDNFKNSPILEEINQLGELDAVFYRLDLKIKSKKLDELEIELRGGKN